MKIKPTIYIVLFLLCSIFLYQNFISEKTEIDEIYVGQVLGVNEKKEINDDLYFSQKSFPENKNFYLSPLKVGEEEIELNNINVGLIMDFSTERILFDKNSEKKVAIASITKLVTVLIFLDLNLDLESVYKITKNDRVNGGRVYVYNGDEITLRNLLHLSLIASANTATCALIRASGLSEYEFVEKMNEKMTELGFENTYFYDAIGLDNNFSTARELAKLAKIAFDNNVISGIVIKDNYEFNTLAGRRCVMSSTDRLLKNYPKNEINLLGGKTGFTNLAGYCFVAKFSRNDNDIISVVLGGDTIKSRFSEAEKMVNWTYNNYIW
ncbi:D-alanyl-D-alanine carboxypeptidase [Candidatus Parcubacteria bacterium]|nr:D-alanyl-D-alanine carboxypeptidase [Candidatus Parcubacteria bacterium]